MPHEILDFSSPGPSGVVIGGGGLVLAEENGTPVTGIGDRGSDGDKDDGSSPGIGDTSSSGSSPPDNIPTEEPTADPTAEPNGDTTLSPTEDTTEEPSANPTTEPTMEPPVVVMAMAAPLTADITDGSAGTGTSAPASDPGVVTLGTIHITATGTELTPGGDTGYTFTGDYSYGKISITGLGDNAGTYYLREDLHSTATDFSIQISVSGVTLDGNGYTLEGDWAGNGVEIQAGADQVTVENFGKSHITKKESIPLVIHLSSEATRYVRILNRKNLDH